MEHLPYATACFPYHFRCAKCKGQGERGWVISSPCNCITCRHCHDTHLTTGGTPVDLGRCWICHKLLSAAKAGWLSEIGQSYNPHAPAQVISDPFPETRQGIFLSYVGGGVRSPAAAAVTTGGGAAGGGGSGGSGSGNGDGGVEEDQEEERQQLSLHDYNEAQRAGSSSSDIFMDGMTGQVRDAKWLTNALLKGCIFHVFVEIKSTYYPALSWRDSFQREDLWIMSLLRTYKVFPQHLAALRMTWEDVMELKGPLRDLFDLWNPQYLSIPLHFWSRSLKTIPEDIVHEFTPPLEIIRRDRLRAMDLSALGMTWRHVRSSTLHCRGGWTERTVRSLLWSPLDWKFMGVVTRVELNELVRTLGITNLKVAKDLGFPVDLRDPSPDARDFDLLAPPPALPVLQPVPPRQLQMEEPIHSFPPEHHVEFAPAAPPTSPAAPYYGGPPPPLPPQQYQQQPQYHQQPQPQQQQQQQTTHIKRSLPSAMSGGGSGRGRGGMGSGGIFAAASRRGGHTE